MKELDAKLAEALSKKIKALEDGTEEDEKQYAGRQILDFSDCKTIAEIQAIEALNDMISEEGYHFASREADVFKAYRRILTTDEHEAAEFLYSAKFPEGYVCPKCGCTEYRTKSRERRVCKNKECRHESTPVSGTILSGLHIPYTVLMELLIGIAADRCGMAALAASREYSVNPNTARLLTRKVKLAQTIAMSKIKFKNVEDVYMDGFYLGGKKKEGKRGRGAAGKLPCEILLAQGIGETSVGYPYYYNIGIKIRITTGEKKAEIKKILSESVGGCTVFRGDRAAAHKGLDMSDVPGFERMQKVLTDSREIKAGDLHSSVDHLISNYVTRIRGTYHGIRLEQAVFENGSEEWKFLYADSTRIRRLKNLVKDLADCPPVTEHEMQDLCLAIKANKYQVNGVDKFYMNETDEKTGEIRKKINRDLCFETLAKACEKAAKSTLSGDKDELEDKARTYRSRIGKSRRSINSDKYIRTVRPGAEVSAMVLEEVRASA